jgi:hemerythrin-like domain-containing protein
VSGDDKPVNTRVSTPVMPGLLARLLQEHRRLETIMAAFERHADERTLSQPEVLDLLSCLIDYVVEVPDRIHHPMEERINERLVDKGLTPGERVLVELTTSEHVELAAWAARLDRDIDALLSHRAEVETGFRQDVSAWLAAERIHMQREEQRLFPLLQRQLSDADWRELEAIEAGLQDPINEARLERYQMLFNLAQQDAIHETTHT